MYASQRVNTDPKPYYVTELEGDGHDGRVTEERVAASARESSWLGGGIIHSLAKLKPRPEFDSNPNPILLDYRMSDGNIDGWLSMLEMPGLLDFLAEAGGEHGTAVTEKHVSHAKKVLTRLANLKKEHGITTRTPAEIADLVMREMGASAYQVPRVAIIAAIKHDRARRQPELDILADAAASYTAHLEDDVIPSINNDDEDLAIEVAELNEIQAALGRYQDEKEQGA